MSGFSRPLHQFINGLDETYAGDNLNVTTFEQLDIDLVMFLDIDAHLHWALFLTDETMDDQLLEQLEINPVVAAALITHSQTDSVVEGVIATRLGPLMISSRPIVRDELKGPIAGSLILGRLLDAKHVKSLQERTELDLGFIPLDDPEITRLRQNVSRDEDGYFQRIESEFERFDYVEI